MSIGQCTATFRPTLAAHIPSGIPAFSLGQSAPCQPPLGQICAPFGRPRFCCSRPSKVTTVQCRVQSEVECSAECSSPLFSLVQFCIPNGSRETPPRRAFFLGLEAGIKVTKNSTCRAFFPGLVSICSQSSPYRWLIFTMSPFIPLHPQRIYANDENAPLLVCTAFRHQDIRCPSM
jgi:hypothetical protein